MNATPAWSDCFRAHRWIRVALFAFVACAAPATALGLEPTISARNAHALLSKADGTVVGWGSDVWGKLGTGRPVVRTTPQRVPNLPPLAQIQTLSFHTLALDTSGRVWSWGQNDWGQLGIRPQRNASLPGRVLGLSNVVSIGASEFYSIAAKSDGTVWTWGRSIETNLPSAALRRLCRTSPMMTLDKSAHPA